MTERERLIELLNKKQDVGIVYNESQTDSIYSESKEISNNELADYLIKSGVIVPPVKVGDTAYKLGWTTCKNGESYPDSYGCCGCEDECDIKRTIVEVKVPTREFIVGSLMDRVTSYYFTYEEAEKALNEQKK